MKLKTLLAWLECPQEQNLQKKTPVFLHNFSKFTRDFVICFEMHLYFLASENDKWVFLTSKKSWPVPLTFWSTRLIGLLVLSKYHSLNPSLSTALVGQWGFPKYPSQQHRQMIDSSEVQSLSTSNGLILMYSLASEIYHIRYIKGY